MTNDDEEKKKPDDLESILNLPSIEPREIAPMDDDTPDDDYEFARDAIRTAMSKGQTALDELVAIALESGHPRAYEVVTMMVKAITDSGKTLLDTKKTDQQIKFINSRKNQPENLTQNLILTTADLGKLLDQKKNEDV